MANFVEGYLKVKCTKAELKALLSNIFYDGATIKEDEWGIDVVELNTTFPGFGAVLSDSKKEYNGYLKVDSGYFTTRGMLDTETRVFLLGKYQAKWSLDMEYFKRISKEYNIEVKVEVYEKGMLFTHVLHCNNGNVVLNKRVNYNTTEDYIWDVACPDFGG